ncbi:MAG: NAD(P)/FAD-dependent oxidoreductase [Actinobacteria bacterium]|nr:NAD(P)/FAD-dependent oxidoreductase [Actinomycetota bacterium]MBU1945294.1 NAD(P)/FAD-dependent oxidoreductase [Actinomycetota bacterium]MBU2686494.1 NAD(P)/FAD-dependent oxidoreductase [Actinomycetota bacterium]
MAEQETVPDFGEHFDAVIIGAGMGGLVCGALLAKAGRKVIIIERHDKPGGYVTSYDRKGYRFQVPHIMGGCGQGGPLTRLFDHLGVRTEFKQVDPFMRFIYPEHDISMGSDIEAYKDALKDGFQPQTESINRFFAAMASVQKGLDERMMRKPMAAGDMLLKIAYPVLHPRMLGYMVSGTTFQKVLDKYLGDDRLKTVVSTPWPFLGAPPWELSALSMMGMLKSFADGAYVPVGGYQVLADDLAKAFTDAGGTFLLGHEATAVNTERSPGPTTARKVSEVETHPRARVACDVVVSDADSKRTFLKLLDRENFSSTFLERIDEGPVSMTGFVIHLGMAREVPEGLAEGVTFVQPSYEEQETLDEHGVMDRYPDPAKLRFSLMAHSITDDSLAPPGKTCLDVLVPAVPYRFMRRWGAEPGGVRGEKYQEIKEKYAEVVTEAVRLAFPDLIGNVEAYDISTPITYERYTMAVDGCWYDSAPVPSQTLGRRPGPRTPLRGLFVTGSKSVLGGGIYASALSGLIAADSVLKGRLRNLY